LSTSVTMVIVLGFYMSFVTSLIPNSMASVNQSIEVTQHTDSSSTFSSLSRNFDETIDDINNKNNNESSIQTANNGLENLQN